MEPGWLFCVRSLLATVQDLFTSLFSRWLNKLGLASIQYEPAERSPAVGERDGQTRLSLLFSCPLCLSCPMTFDLLFAMQSVTVKPVTTRRPKAQRFLLHRTPKKPCGTPAVRRVHLVARIRSANRNAVFNAKSLFDSWWIISFDLQRIFLSGHPSSPVLLHSPQWS